MINRALTTVLPLLLLSPVFAADKPAAAPAETRKEIAVADKDKDLADGDSRIGPNYHDCPELAAKDGVPKGAVHEFTMGSEESKIYPGIRGPYKRKVWVYVPSQYVEGSKAPFIIAQDGGG